MSLTGEARVALPGWRARRGSPLALFVAGKPAPQGSKRPIGRGRMVEMSKALGPWREAVRAEVQRARADWPGADMPAAGMEFPGARWLATHAPLQVSVQLVLPRPAAHYRTGRNSHLLKDVAPGFPVGRPDVDKLARAVLDGLEMGGLFADDAQVVALAAAKVYALAGEPMGAAIVVEEIND